MISVNTKMAIINGTTKNVAMIQLMNAKRDRHSVIKHMDMGVENFEFRENILWRQLEHI